MLNKPQRHVVQIAIKRVSTRRNWHLHAINVRTNHVHVVISASPLAPEQVKSQFKAWASRELRSQSPELMDARVWTKMGSTRWLNDERSCAAAIDYVVRCQ